MQCTDLIVETHDAIELVWLPYNDTTGGTNTQVLLQDTHHTLVLVLRTGHGSSELINYKNNKVATLLILDSTCYNPMD